MTCGECHKHLDLIPTREPYNAAYWQCDKCDSTYFMTEMTQEEFNKRIENCVVNREYKFNTVANQGNSHTPDSSSDSDSTFSALEQYSDLLGL